MPAVAESSAQARVRNSLLNLSLGLLTQVSPLPLHDPSSVFEFVEMNNSLRGCVRAVREIGGDQDTTPLQRHVHTAVQDVPGKIRFASCIDKSFVAVKTKLGSGSLSGPVAFELLLKDFAQNFSLSMPHKF